ncbi:Clavaminate synthase-like protein [Auriscalpium vulgare]|uniref:Clavaminate synthase-like protein n=1 Tax=Auriscalpium vulgare TaxID=40419 RepID=A0ACB8RCN6_9AGAM|nr:Clavaminate synthase-like protein [Auriscalpium vulgare]
MAIELAPLPLPPSVDVMQFRDVGREVKGVDPGSANPAELEELKTLLFKHDILLFRDCRLSPEKQYALAKIFDPSSETFGHGNNKIDRTKKSILHPYLKTIPRVPQVQLIGNGAVYDHEGIPEAHLKHASHTAFHKTHISPADAAAGATRFYRWHMDAALYELDPPVVTTLYALAVPRGAPQVVRYDDGKGDELPVPLATTAFVSGRTMFEVLPPELKSLAVRTRVRYAPHPFQWMAPAGAMSDGLGLETEGKERPLSELTEWSEEDVKVYPVLWKNPVTKGLHFMVNATAAQELFVAPLPDSASREGRLFPNGAHITDLKEVRELLHKMQRPGISPNQLTKLITTYHAEAAIPRGKTGPRENALTHYRAWWAAACVGLATRRYHMPFKRRYVTG